MKNSSSINSIPDSEKNVNSLEENYLTDAEKSFINELNAHMSEKLLGEDEAFIQKLVRDNFYSKREEGTTKSGWK